MINEIKSMLENKVRETALYNIDQYGKDNVPTRYRGKEIVTVERDYEDSSSPIWEMTYYAASSKEGSVSFRARFSRDGKFLYDCPEQVSSDIRVEILL